MARMLTAMLLVGTLALVGCNDNKKRMAASNAAPPPVTDTMASAKTLPPPPEMSTMLPPVAPEPPRVTFSDPGPAPLPAPRAVKAAPAPSPKAAKTAGGKSYTIQKGDTLWSIAQAKYGSGMKWKQIAAANPGLNPDRIQAGKTIALP